MNLDLQIRSVSLFFYLTILDEAAASRAATKAFLLCQKQIKKEDLDLEEIQALVVRCTAKVWQKMKKRLSPNLSAMPYSEHFQLPSSVELGPWRQFRKESDDDEFLAVLWSRVLKVSDADIALGLGITEGTLRHRVNRGLRILGRKRRYGGFDG